MHLLKLLLDNLPEEPIPIRRVIIGLHWTLVASRYCGLSSTVQAEGPHGESRVRDVGTLHLKSAQELAGWALSDNSLEASLGMAAINSLLELDESHLSEVNAAEVIARESKGRNLVVVGHFPFVKNIQPHTRNCWVIEKRPAAGEHTAEEARTFIPQADVVAITGTAFVNHSLPGLLALCPPTARVMVLGPSTPLSPLLFQHGIHFLSGAQVVDEDAAVLTIQQAASLPQVKGVRLITMKKEDWS
jgi:uncharacterized protein (DUF4213/DUF364 family)